MIDLGFVAVNATIHIPWASYSAIGASATATGYVAADVEIYKNGSVTQRASDNGVTATTDFDSLTGLHLITIDLSDNSDASFFAAGSVYLVAVSTVTIDSQTVSFWAARFSIGPIPANTTQVGGTSQTARDLGASVLLSTGTGTGQLDFTSGVVKANVTQYGGSNATSASGRPEVNVAYIAGTLVSTTTAQLGVNAVQAGGTAWGSGAITTGAFAAGAINAAAIADAAIDRATFAADTGLQTIRSNTAQAGAAGTVTLDASASAVTDFYVGDLIYLTGGTGIGQARICTAYNGTTKVATITPNWATNPDVTSTFAVLPGDHPKVDSSLQVTAASVQGAVTGAVASVTGNVGGNVTGSIGSLAAQAKADVNAEADTALSDYGGLKPTTAGRTLDVSAGGEAGVDWANVGSPTTTVGLSGTTVKTATDVEADTQDLQGRLPAALTADGNIKADALRLGGTVQTGRDVGASVLLSSGSGTGQLDFTSGVVKANATQFGGSAGTFSGGRAEVNASHAAGVAWASGAIVRAAFAADTGLQAIRSNTAAGGAAGSITLDASASATTDFYVGAVVYVTGGTGVGQARVVTAYNGTTKVATVLPAWATAPDNTSTFALLAGDWGGLKPTTAGRTLDVSAGGEGGVDWANVGSPTTTNNLSGTTVKTLTDAPADSSGITTLLSRLSSARAGYLDNLSAGAAALEASLQGLITTIGASAAGVATAVWGAATRLLTAGTNIALAKGTGVTGFNDLSAAQVNAEADTALADVGVTTTITGRIDAAVTTRAPEAGGNVAAIKTQTDKLTFTVANQIDANVLDWKSATAPAMTGDAYARLGAPAGASTAADIAAVKAETAAIKAKTDNLPAAPAAVGNIPTAAANADAVWEEAIADHGGTVGSTAEALTAAAAGGGGGGLNAAGMRAALGMASANLDTQLAAIDGNVDDIELLAASTDSDVAAIKAKTDNLPADPASSSDVSGGGGGSTGPWTEV